MVRQILNTPMEAKSTSGLLGDGVQLGVSSRGMGSLVQREGVSYVGEDFLATAADIVDPSLLTLSFGVSWKVKNGFGTMDS